MPQPPRIPLVHNARFYILCGTLIVSLAMAALLRLHIMSDQLYYIRLEQSYGLLSIICLYLAMLISPLQKALGVRPWLQRLVFMRRAIGVSAAYYAVLHMTIALWGQIGGIGAIKLLPVFFVWSLSFGLAAIIILLVMAATSFDAVIKRMTFFRWKLLHRLIYIGGVLIILHVWIIGTHVAYGWAQLAASLAVALLLGLEALRAAKQLAKRYTALNRYVTLTAIGIWIAGLGSLAVIPLAVERYHTKHSQIQHEAGHHE